MRKALLYYTVALCIYSCKSKKEIQYIPVKEIRTEEVILRDTIVNIQLIPYQDSVSVQDTLSFLENTYALSYASYTGGTLNHSLRIKHIALPTEIVIQEKIIRDSIPYPVHIQGETIIKIKRDFLWWTGLTLLLLLFGVGVFKLARLLNK